MKTSVTNQLKLRSLKNLDAKQIAKLAEPDANGSRVVTLQMPMERKGADTRKNSIVFKNMLSEAREQLDASDALLARLDELQEFEDPVHSFWQEQKEGLILVIREEGENDAFLLPFSLDSTVTIGESPSLSPLFLLTGGGQYHLLALNLGGLRLFKASRWDLEEEIQLTHVPSTLDEAMKYDDPEESLQSRSVSSSNMPGAGGGNVAFNGQGVTGDEMRNKKIRRFFEMVDKGLPKNFNDLEMPLVLMGPDFEISLYREVNHYPHLCEQHIATSVAHLSDDELTQTICEWVAERDAADRSQEIDKLNDRIGLGEASIDFKEIVKGAETARIDTLLVDEKAQRWGTSDPSNDQVILHDEQQPDSQELVGAATLAAAASGARIQFIEAGEKLPGEAPLAAVFRY